ncbi:DUF2524 family protein [Halalkalibacter oceani]|uniref:YtzC family protein n=1 Tax=Halalkalibacter oceani TaxID=1653776 RepID=A0A9X2DR08_9BACI|nr:DUF2524 family protein [Halalkalibacter oceani]MCM3713533.1 YtzC family protein [Halalkalibacter oceani]MCM3761281.1 YtzC family protein [Halalkalibacter oceani]
MAEHSSLEQSLQKAEKTLAEAEQVFEHAQRLEGTDPDQYRQAQLQLEEISEELDALSRAATPEQRDQVSRTQQQVRQLQNHFILRR